MTTRDLHSQIKVVQLIAAATYDADNTPVELDRRGFRSVEIILAIGVGGITFTGTNKVEFKLTASEDETAGGTYADVTADDLLGVTSVTDGIIKSLIAAHGAAAVYKYGYIGYANFLKLLADYSGSHAAGTPLAAIAVLSDPISAPVA